MLKKITLAALITLSGMGCATRIGDFTVLSTKNFEVGAKYKTTGRVSAEDIGFLFKTANLKTATDKAIEKGKGVYITNVVLEAVTKFPGISGFRVTGDVYAPVEVGYVPKAGERLFELIQEGRELFLVTEGQKIAVRQ